MRRILSSARTKRFTNQTTGARPRRSGVSTYATSGAMRSACVAPTTFGVISENTRIRNVTTTVLMASASSPVAEEPRGDHAGQRRRARVDEVVAEQDDAEQAVGLREQRHRELGALVAALRAVLQAVAVDGHHRRLRHREEPRDDEQHGERDGEGA